MFTKSVLAKCPYRLGRLLKDLRFDGLDYTVKRELSRYTKGAFHSTKNSEISGSKLNDR